MGERGKEKEEVLRNLSNLGKLFGEVEEGKRLPAISLELIKARDLVENPLELRQARPKFLVSESRWTKETLGPVRVNSFPRETVSKAKEKLRIITVSIAPFLGYLRAVNEKGEAYTERSAGLCVLPDNRVFSCEEEGLFVYNSFVPLSLSEDLGANRVWLFRPQQYPDFPFLLNLWEGPAEAGSPEVVLLPLLAQFQLKSHLAEIVKKVR